MLWLSRRISAPPPRAPAPPLSTHNLLLDITADTEAIILNGVRIGHLRFVVENRSSETLILRCAAMAREPLDPAWLTPRLPTFELDAGDRRAVVIDINVPATAPAGVRIAHLLVWSVTNPDEDFLAGPEVAVTVPTYRAPRRMHIPWWVWVLLAALALVAGNALGATAVVRDFQHIPSITRVGVPALVGLTSEAAANALGTRLIPGTFTTRCTAQAPRGTVVTQFPEIGTIVSPGTAVDILVEDGWALPDFRSREVTTAIASCAAHGFTTTIITRVDPHHAEPFGTVVSQAPLPSSIVGTGTIIQLTVLGGVVLPNLVGVDHGKAVQALTALGLRLRPRLMPALGRVSPGMTPIVMAQDPPAGQQVLPGASVTLDLQVQPRP